MDVYLFAVAADTRGDLLMNYEEKLDRLYPKLRIGKKCANPACHNPACHIHHIVRRNVDLLRFDVKNLLPLCDKCHRQIHDEGLYNRGMDFIEEPRRDYLLRMKNVDFKQFLLELNITKDDFFAQKEREILANIGKSEFKQNTPEWLEEKNFGIGASEIAAVVKSFVPQKDLMEIMGDKPALNFLSENLFSTGYQVYHKIKKGYRSEPLPDELNIYGHAMEKYLDFKMKDDANFHFSSTDDFIKRPDISPYAVCSPDGYAESVSDSFVDVNCKPQTAKRLVWEKKTVNPFKAARENIFYNGLPWQYIFQNQYQMLLCNCEAGIISSMVLTQDTPFNRGRIVSLIEQGLFEEIDRLFEIRIDNFIYGIIPEIQTAINTALKNFEKAIAENRTPEINDKCARLAENDFRIYQAVYKSNPDARKLATSQDKFENTTLDEYLNEYIGLNEIIKDNNEQDKLRKTLLKKYMYDNKFCELYTMDGGYVRLSASGSLLTRVIK